MTANTPVDGVSVDLSDRLLAKVEEVRREAREEWQATRKDVHQLRNEVAVVHTDNREHAAEDDGRFATISLKLDAVIGSVAKIENQNDRVADRQVVGQRWLIGLALGVVIAVAGTFLATRDRVGELENRQENVDRQFRDMGRTLDRIEDRLYPTPHPVPIPVPVPVP